LIIAAGSARVTRIAALKPRAADLGFQAHLLQHLGGAACDLRPAAALLVN
jgi:hypothetical protein